ncbi:putative nucleotidyltransferase substrate binding domain-containing protein [Dasania marina]|uniref:putative nucleotidyltransferase substrate binding domain-containing protein n=1 Tax=Dasania marina TaxID=471499 RepID=UPI00036E90A9|nr:putative nucleotidyltransferase substrate binding domain-containing protein [Dasania marina]
MVQLTDQPEILPIIEFMQDCLPFNSLSAPALNDIARQLHIIYYRKGQVLTVDVNQASGLRILRSGAVEIRSHDGQLLDRLAETESFNLDGLNADNDGVKAVIIEDCLLYCLPADDYQLLREQHRFFDRYFHSQRSRRLRRAVRYEAHSHIMMQPVSSLMCENVLTVAVHTTIQETAKIMTSARVSSAMVMDGKMLLGIVTDRDLRSRVLSQGVSVDAPIEQVMTADPYSIASTDTVFDATLQMTQRGCHHLPVINKGELVGVITTSDLMLAKRDDPVYLVQHISRQQDVEGLKNIASALPSVLQSWVASDGRPHQLSKVLTAVSDAITQRLIALAIEQLGEPPVPFAWLGFGSQARVEQILGADQDNGLIVDNAMLAEHDVWFKRLANFVCDGLDQCGYPYCNGKIMATTGQWRQTLSGWKKTVNTWAYEPDDDAVMRVSIFFDVRVIYGDKALADELQQHMLSITQKDTIFLAALAANVLSQTPPLGVFRRFLVERSGEHRDSFNLKKRGVMPIVDMVRIHALANGVEAVNTRERIAALIDKKVMTLVDGRNLQDAFDFIMQLRVQHQAEQLAAGTSPNNYCNPRDLPDLSRHHLRDAFKVVHEAQDVIRLKYRGGMG